MQVGRSLADVSDRPMDSFHQRFQAAPKRLIISRTAQSTIGSELHVLYTAIGTGQSSQLFRFRAQLLRQHEMNRSLDVQFRLMMLQQMMLPSTRFAQMLHHLLTIHDRGQMDRGGVGAELTLHADPSCSESFELPNLIPKTRCLFIRFLQHGILQLSAQPRQFRLLLSCLGQSPRSLATMPRVAVKIFQQRIQLFGKDFIVMGAAEPGRFPEIDQPQAAMRTLPGI
jgi:hypothetical protein